MARPTSRPPVGGADVKYADTMQLKVRLDIDLSCVGEGVGVIIPHGAKNGLNFNILSTCSTDCRSAKYHEIAIIFAMSCAGHSHAIHRETRRVWHGNESYR